MVEPPQSPGGTLPTSTPAGVSTVASTRHTRGPSPSTQSRVARGRRGQREAGHRGCGTGARRQDHLREAVDPLGTPPQLHLPAVGPEQRGPQPAQLTAGRRGPDGVGARQRGAALAGGHARGRDPRHLGPGAARALEQPVGGRGREPGAAALAGKAVDAGAEQVRGLRGEDRVRLGLGRRADGVEHADAGEHVARCALEQQRALTGADPDLVVLRGRRGTRPADSRWRGGTRTARTPSDRPNASRRARADDAPASSVYQIPPLAAAA